MKTGALMLFLLLPGCAIGPNYRRPAINVPDVYRGEPAAAAASVAELPWWQIFRDGTLTTLIRGALTNNYDARIALARVEQSRAQTVQARSALLPQINYEAKAGRGRQSFLGNPISGGDGGGSQTKNAFLADFNAAWEVDLFGRVRRLNEVARAQFFASEEARDGMMLALVSDVAQAYFELLALDRQLEVANHAVTAFNESLQLFTQRLQGGVGSKLETSRAETALATTAASIPELQRQILLKENQINVLMGRNPGPVPHTTTLAEQTLPPDVPAGLPSALLERRPDIREAEQNLRAANAQIGVALGAFFPRIGLTALYGGVSPELSTLTTGGANAWALAANLAGPLFQGGRLIGQYRQARALWEESQLRYQQTALNAFQEVSDALITRQQLELIRVQQSRAVTAGQEAVTVALERYRAGKANYFEVLDAQEELFPSENALAETQRNQLLVMVQLYKSLGGGWDNLKDERE